MTTENAVAEKRGPQVAIVPISAIDIKDVASGAAVFDAWLQEVSGGMVTLERIQGVAGALPVVGNIMALVDALGDVVTLTKTEKRDLLLWASLAINLIGVLPLPPTMAAARMTLRPTLHLVRQEMRSTTKLMLSASVVEILVGHLNASIVGSLDDFVTQAKAKLPDILADAGKLGEDVLNEIAKGLEAAVNGTLDAGGDLDAAGAQISAAGDQLLHDPKAAISNIFGGLFSAYKAAGKGMANSATQHLLPDDIKQSVLTHTAQLRAMGPELRTQLNKLTAEDVEYSIGWLLLILSSASALWRKRNPSGQGTSVKPNETNKAKKTAAEGEVESVEKQAVAQGTPNCKKNVVCPITDNSISFAVGSETFSHTDFSLPGLFPINWTRTYYSRLASYDHGSLGARWINEFTTRFDLHDKGLVFHDADGRDHTYTLKPVGEAHYDAIENLTLVRVTDNSLLLCRGFERRETYVRHGDRFLLAHIELRNGAGVMLHHEYRHADQPVLSDLITYQGDLTNVHLHLGTMIDDHGHLKGLWEIRDGAPVRQLAAYYYDAHGDLINAQDENGAAWS
ncbi:DUF6531 domain-containing protein, partial [Pseudomonas sp. TWR3-1-1]|uniref:DUF6531 domain-containing protein n=1 Tax=Pseudomonas sp. TWR3-1-1 TaxID=2804633 RepID=UPI003CE6B794